MSYRWKPDLGFLGRDLEGTLRTNFNQVAEVLNDFDGRFQTISRESQSIDLGSYLTRDEADELYESIIEPKNTAFNKNFGTGNSDVARGDHGHTIDDIDGLQEVIDDLIDEIEAIPVIPDGLGKPANNVLFKASTEAEAFEWRQSKAEDVFSGAFNPEAFGLPKNLDIVTEFIAQNQSGFFADRFLREHTFDVYEDIDGEFYCEIDTVLEEWDPGTPYTEGKSVHYNGFTWRASQDNTGETPSAESEFWDIGFVWTGNLEGFHDGSTDLHSLNTSTGPGVDGAAKVQLVKGTNTSPIFNWVYVDQIPGTIELELKVSPFSPPANPAIILGYALVYGSGTKPAPVQRFSNSPYRESRSQSLLTAIQSYIRISGALYFQGLNMTLNIDTLEDPDSVLLQTTDGTVVQQWSQQIPANQPDSTSNPDDYFPIRVLNDPISPYRVITDLNELTYDALGNSLTLNNRSFGFNLVLVASSGTDNHEIGVLLPSGSYASETAAISDVNNYANTQVSQEFRFTTLNLCRAVLKYTNASGGTYVNVLGGTDVQDLRGVPVNAGGSGAGTGSSLWEVNLSNDVALKTPVHRLYLQRTDDPLQDSLYVDGYSTFTNDVSVTASMTVTDVLNMNTSGLNIIIGSGGTSTNNYIEWRQGGTAYGFISANSTNDDFRLVAYDSRDICFITGGTIQLDSNSVVDGTLQINNVANVGTDQDAWLQIDGAGVVRYRTTNQLSSDIALVGNYVVTDPTGTQTIDGGGDQALVVKRASNSTGPLIADQLSTGDIQNWRVGGVEKCKISNAGSFFTEAGVEALTRAAFGGVLDASYDLRSYGETKVDGNLFVDGGAVIGTFSCGEWGGSANYASIGHSNYANAEIKFQHVYQNTGRVLIAGRDNGAMELRSYGGQVLLQARESEASPNNLYSITGDYSTTYKWDFTGLTRLQAGLRVEGATTFATGGAATYVLEQRGVTAVPTLRHSSANANTGWQANDVGDLIANCGYGINSNIRFDFEGTEKASISSAGLKATAIRYNAATPTFTGNSTYVSTSTLKVYRHADGQVSFEGLLSMKSTAGTPPSGALLASVSGNPLGLTQSSPIYILVANTTGETYIPQWVFLDYNGTDTVIRYVYRVDSQTGDIGSATLNFNGEQKRCQVIA